METRDTDLVPRGEPEQPSQAVFGTSPASVVTYAVEVANALTPVIEKQGFYSIIGGKKYVRVEAWCILGNMLGFLPREVSVKDMPDGSAYEATVELVSVKNGHSVCRASAICGTDEKRWANADRYARRSMAITRATGKAYRLAFSWIIALSGYEATPAEEMPGEDSHPAPQRAPKYSHTDQQAQAWLKERLAKTAIPSEQWKDFSMQFHGEYQTEMALEVKAARWLKS